jgi:adenylate kinase
MRIALFGAPGAGKGSQATLLVKNVGLEHISTGVILRQAMRDGTEVGRKAKKYMEAGSLVPGKLVRALAEDAIAAQDYDQFVLDGYPRTIEQADWLTEFLTEHAAPLLAVVSLDVPDSVIVNRISKRRVHVKSGENYHLDFKPPPADVDPALIIQRADDRPESVMHRLKVYHEQTAPVEAYYRERGLLVEVDGIGSFAEVHERILSSLKELQSAV